MVDVVMAGFLRQALAVQVLAVQVLAASWQRDFNHGRNQQHNG
jgi:hypothetical protein